LVWWWWWALAVPSTRAEEERTCNGGGGERGVGLNGAAAVPNFEMAVPIQNHDLVY